MDWSCCCCCMFSMWFICMPRFNIGFMLICGCPGPWCADTLNQFIVPSVHYEGNRNRNDKPLDHSACLLAPTPLLIRRNFFNLPFKQLYKRLKDLVRKHKNADMNKNSIRDAPDIRFTTITKTKCSDLYVSWSIRLAASIALIPPPEGFPPDCISIIMFILARI